MFLLLDFVFFLKLETYQELSDPLLFLSELLFFLLFLSILFLFFLFLFFLIFPRLNSPSYAIFIFYLFLSSYLPDIVLSNGSVANFTMLKFHHHELVISLFQRLILTSFKANLTFSHNLQSIQRSILL